MYSQPQREVVVQGTEEPAQELDVAPDVEEDEGELQIDEALQLEPIQEEFTPHNIPVENPPPAPPLRRTTWPRRPTVKVKEGKKCGILNSQYT